LLKAVIFDMDGVIIDSEPQHAKAAVLALEKYQVSIPIEYAYNFIGTSTPVMCKKMIEDFHLNATVEELNTANEEAKEALIRSEGYPVIPYITELMWDLHKNGIKLIIASSSSAPAIEGVMNSLGINGIFDGYISGMNMKHPKPAPDIFLAAAKQLGVEPSECLVIEDSCHGVTAAAAAGITSIGFVNPNSGKQDLSKAAMLIEGFEEVDYSFLLRVYQRDHMEPVSILSTNRCILRELSPEDADNLFTICIKPEIRTHLWGFTADPEVEQEKLNAYIKNIYPFYGFGLWGVYRKDGNLLIGRCGIERKEHNKEIVYELGYLIDPDYQRKGYGSEIVTATIDYCLNKLAIPKITAFIAPDNTPSLRLAERAGMKKVGVSIINQKNYYRYEIIG
jgi:HAD superfamily hydrolase (TIGR01509 family)